MIEIYLTDNNPRARLLKIAEKRLSSFEWAVTENGKPYFEGNPFYFSYSHSGERGLLAIYEKPIGVDFELFRGRIRESVFLRFSERERTEIAGERDFLYHWTAREAYIKLYGLTLAKMLKRVEFLGGNIYVDGEKQPVRIRKYVFWCGVGAVCTEEII